MDREVKSNRWTDEEMMVALKTSETISDVLRKLGLTVRPGNYETVYKFIQRYNIDTSHMTGKRCGRGRVEPKSLDEILIDGSSYKRQDLKRRMILAGLLVDKCSICGQEPQWQSQKLTLILDHLNGKRDDNRKENLRLLCPNCNSQQPTFCRGMRAKKKYTCLDCGCKVTSRAKRCVKCDNAQAVKRAKRKVEIIPSKNEMDEMIRTLSWVDIGQKYGITDNAVKKMAKRLGCVFAVRSYQRR